MKSNKEIMDEACERAWAKRYIPDCHQLLRANREVLEAKAAKKPLREKQISLLEPVRKATKKEKRQQGHYRWILGAFVLKPHGDGFAIFESGAQISEVMGKNAAKRTLVSVYKRHNPTWKWASKRRYL